MKTRVPDPTGNRTLRDRLGLAIQRRVSNRLGMITRIETDQPVLALTFDDGPDSKDTPALLQLLQRHAVPATFFLVGKSASEHPQLVQELQQQGHAIGNHSWDHPGLSGIPVADRWRQIRRAQPHTTEPDCRLYRPPFGDFDYVSALLLALSGYRVIGWSSDAGDWDCRDAATLARRLHERTRPGAIILMHDTLFSVGKSDYPPRDVMLQGLDEWLSAAVRQYRFVTVPQLLHLGEARRRPIRPNRAKAGYAPG